MLIIKSIAPKSRPKDAYSGICFFEASAAVGTRRVETSHWLLWRKGTKGRGFRSDAKVGARILILLAAVVAFDYFALLLAG